MGGAPARGGGRPDQAMTPASIATASAFPIRWPSRESLLRADRPIRPLPGARFSSAECDNLLAQGYVSVNTHDGQVFLVPAFRSFRGGVSLQF